MRRVLFKLVEGFMPDETAIMVILAVLVGLLGGFGAILFRWLVDLFQGLTIGGGRTRFHCWRPPRGGRSCFCRWSAG